MVWSWDDALGLLFDGHWARKCVSLLHTLQRMTCPSDPMGFWRLPLPLPVDLLPLPFRPFPKNSPVISSSVISVRNEKRDFPFPLPFPFLLTKRRTLLVGFCMCLLQLDLALLYCQNKCSSCCAGVMSCISASHCASVCPIDEDVSVSVPLSPVGACCRYVFWGTG